MRQVLQGNVHEERLIPSHWIFVLVDQSPQLKAVHQSHLPITAKELQVQFRRYTIIKLLRLRLEDVAVNAPGGLDPIETADDLACLGLVEFPQDDVHLADVHLRGVDPGAFKDVGSSAP